MKKIDFFRHCIDDNDIKRANKVLRSIFLTTGTEVAEFEKNFAAYTGRPYALGMTSCTAALHLSLVALGIGHGDEVITTPLSFCATSNSILHSGARPVFVDVENGTGNINANLVEAAITERTKAIMPVHLYGQMCDMRKLNEIAARHGLFIIEDAAHSIEASRDGVRVGQLADTACYSFYATKNITSGEGGAVTTGDSMLAEKLRLLRLHGIDKSAADRYTKRFEHWDMPVLGWKYNMDNIQAALLIGQLERIEFLWQKRNSLWKAYEEALADISGLMLPSTLSDSKHAHHLFTVFVPETRRDEILHSLQLKGIGVAVNYRPIHLLRYYRETFGYRDGDFPVAEKIGRSTISLPFHLFLEEEDILRVADTLRNELIN